MSYDREYVMVHFVMLVALPRGISAWKLKIHKIDGSKYCAKNNCNMMLITPRWHKHPSSGANRSSDVAATVNINDQFNLSLI
jgi:hypothetical protein